MVATAEPRAALFALMLMAGLAHAEGLSVSPDSVPWPRWQARLGVTTTTGGADTGATTQLQSARLFGDYYFTGPGFGAGRVAGGLRATSGLLSGSRAGALSVPTMPSRQGLPLSLSARQAAADGGPDAGPPVAYLGVGYTGVSLRGGWEFTADVGLMQEGVRFGRNPSAGQPLDDLLRDLRLTPVLQLGVSYSF